MSLFGSLTNTEVDQPNGKKFFLSDPLAIADAIAKGTKNLQPATIQPTDTIAPVTPATMGTAEAAPTGMAQGPVTGAVTPQAGATRDNPNAVSTPGQTVSNDPESQNLPQPTVSKPSFLQALGNPNPHALTTKGDILSLILAGGIGALAGGGQRTAAQGAASGYNAVHNLEMQGPEQQQAQAAADTASANLAHLPDQQKQQADESAARVAAQTATGNLKDAQADVLPDTVQLKTTAAQAGLANHGLKITTNENGQISVVPDTESPIYKTRQQKDELISAQTDATYAQEEVREAQAEVNRQKADPHSQASQMAQQRLAIARQNASAAGLRAQAYWGNYLQHSQNIGLDGKPLAGATVIADDNGNQSIVGSTNAKAATTAQSGAAQFNDVHGALDSVENSARHLVQSGGSLNSAAVAAAMAQPKGTLEQWLQGAGAKSGLTPQERAYVQSVAAAHENIQALRKSAGGTATDSAVAKLDSMIPNASTPDLDYLLGQTNQIRQTATRLGKGATTATGGLSVQGQTHPHDTIPAAAAAQLSEGVQHTFGNGQTWTKVNGVPTRVK